MLSNDDFFFEWYFSKSIYWIVFVWFSFLNSFSTKISGMTIPPANELKNCLLFSCSTMLASNCGAVIPLLIKNFSYSVLENLSSLKNDLSFLIISLRALSLTTTPSFSISNDITFFPI